MIRWFSFPSRINMATWVSFLSTLFFFPSCQVFKRHNPSTAEEQEMMENLFDALCSCLMLSANRDRFLRGEGLQLMNLMLRWGCNTLEGFSALGPTPLEKVMWNFKTLQYLHILIKFLVQHDDLDACQSIYRHNSNPFSYILVFSHLHLFLVS